MRTSRRLIDCLLIKGRLTDAQDNDLTGTLRVWIPGHGGAGKLIKVWASRGGKFKVKIHGYTPNRRIRFLAESPGFLPLEYALHPKAEIWKTGQFDGYKIVRGGDLVMQPAMPDFLWYTQVVSQPA